MCAMRVICDQKREMKCEVFLKYDEGWRMYADFVYIAIDTNDIAMDMNDVPTSH